MRLIIFGPPGAGKGTQAQLLSDRFKIPQIAMGDLLRDVVLRGTELGKMVKVYIDRGQLVPDEIVIKIMEERLEQPDRATGFILDGFPRTMKQAEALEDILNKLGVKLDASISLEVNEEELVKRIVYRRTCRKCGAVYHLIFNPPKKDGSCDRCDGSLYQRDDDREETLRLRLKVYKEQTEPILRFYEARELLKRVNGSLPVEKVFEEILKALHITQSQHSLRMVEGLK